MVLLFCVSRTCHAFYWTQRHTHRADTRNERVCVLDRQMSYAMPGNDKNTRWLSLMGANSMGPHETFCQEWPAPPEPARSAENIAQLLPRMLVVLSPGHIDQTSPVCLAISRSSGRPLVRICWVKDLRMFPFKVQSVPSAARATLCTTRRRNPHQSRPKRLKCIAGN